MKTVVVRDEDGAEPYSAAVDVYDRKVVAKHEAAIVKRFGTSFTVESEAERVVIQLQRKQSPEKGLKNDKNNLLAVSHRARKSFETAVGKLATPREPRERKEEDHAVAIPKRIS